MASDTDRARVHRRTCSALCRPRKRPAAASSTAAAAPSATAAGMLTGLTWLPAKASAAATTVRPKRSHRARAETAFNTFAVCDHTLCRCHAQSTADDPSPATRPQPATPQPTV
jgi:hypothetical protein